MTSSVMTRRPRRLASTMKRLKSFMVPKSGLMRAVVGDVVAVVAAGRRIERQQPQRGDAEILQIVELFGQPGEIADAVIVAVGKGLDVKLVDDGVLVPELVAIERGDRQLCCIDGGQQVHGVPSRQTAKQQGGIAHRIDPQPDAAPFERIALAGEEVLERRDVAAVVGHADLDIAERQPEFVHVARQRDGGDDAVGLIDRFLDEGDDVAVVDRAGSGGWRSAAAPRFAGGRG